MKFSNCVKTLSSLLTALILLNSSGALAETLAAPRPKKSQDYNYTNGEVGSNALGLSAADAADINEADLLLAKPKLKTANIVDSDLVLDGEKNSPECLDSCNK